MFHLRLLKRKRLQLLAARCGIPTPKYDFKCDRLGFYLTRLLFFILLMYFTV